MQNLGLSLEKNLKVLLLLALDNFQQIVIPKNQRLTKWHTSFVPKITHQCVVVQLQFGLV